jgi:GntR family transcriptional repressor for pyruvate dehydrogenase complex
MQLILKLKNNEWLPGDKLPVEMALAEMFNVSRNVIREVMKFLGFFRIIEQKPGLGFFVTKEAPRYIAIVELLGSMTRFLLFHRTHGNPAYP